MVLKKFATFCFQNLYRIKSINRLKQFIDTIKDYYSTPKKKIHILIHQSNFNFTLLIQYENQKGYLLWNVYKRIFIENQILDIKNEKEI